MDIAESTSRARAPSGNSLPSYCIVITGASSGLGAGLARAYAAPGRTLGLTGLNERRLTAVAETCRRSGAAVQTATLDVSDSDAMSNWLLALDTATPIDLLIANAGVSAGTRPDGQPEGLDAARGVVQVNLLGVINTVEPLLPRLLQRGTGQIAMVGSLAAFRGLPDSPAYCASKAGIIAYGESLRCALEPRGVRVSVIVPGFFVSPMSAQFAGQKLFLLSEARAVTRITDGLRRRERRIVFPRRLALLLRIVNLLPARHGDRIMRAFRFRIAARSDPVCPF